MNPLLKASCKQQHCWEKGTQKKSFCNRAMAANEINPRQTLGDRPVNLVSPPPVQKGTVPTDAEIAAEVVHTYALKKFKSSNGYGVPAVTDDELATACKHEHLILDAATTKSADFAQQLATITRQNNRIIQQNDENKNLMKAYGINARAIAHNAKQTDAVHRLKPLAKEKAGGGNSIGTVAPLMSAPGGLFPEDVHELDNMQANDITRLSTFYGDDFGIVAGDTIRDKVHKFRMFIG
ncbi:hypothetical protein KFL_007180050 [Klebsormidium nitens]|uniref:Uncharacterized protein n=1 Tax=Klebsormidium nitens TaxID=105231 RepID=A0A1Y1IJS3_KLENI|nr:hypothetical protein KFL_007180050 [Klebsormidium nitens]|eukprot:GAQ91044.1 hypothetical protein KFL_007180050 [Klebsormidium nitens]